jgi:hypothetical protein
MEGEGLRDVPKHVGAREEPEDDVEGVSLEHGVEVGSALFCHVWVV